MKAAGDSGRAPRDQGAAIVVRVDPRTVKTATTVLGVIVGVMLALALFRPVVGRVGHRLTPLQRFAYAGGALASFFAYRFGIRRSQVALYNDRVEVTADAHLERNREFSAWLKSLPYLRKRMWLLQ